MDSTEQTLAKRVALFVGLGILLLALLIPPPAGMPLVAWLTAGVALMMAVWWATEALPIAATSLVPIVMFPILGIVPIREVKVSNYFGSGQIEDMAAAIQALALNVVIVNGELTPIQQRNLERALNVKVIDRTGLILEIFGLRAATKEGRLQVELARLNYEHSRLVRTWTHLERQRGGQGFLSGPGETQIESDRRQLNEKIDRLKAQLEAVRRTRDLQRRLS